MLHALPRSLITKKIFAVYKCCYLQVANITFTKHSLFSTCFKNQTRTHTHAHMHTHMYTRAHAHTHTHTHVHVHTHAHMPR